MEARRLTPIEWILEAGCQATGTTLAEVKSRSRLRELVRKRKFIACKMRQEGYGYSAIGRAPGGRDHVTIMYYLGAH